MDEKVYIVWYDNGACYCEDAFYEIEIVCKTVEEAKRYIEEKGYTRKEPYRFRVEHEEYRIVDNSIYYNPDLENDMWRYNSHVEIREYSIRSDNTVYNEKKESEYKPSEADTE